MTPHERHATLIGIGEKLMSLVNDLEAMRGELQLTVDQRAIRCVIRDLVWAAENCTVVGLHQIEEGKGDILLFLLLARPAAGAEGRFEAKLLRRSAGPCVAAERAAAGEAALHRLQFRRRFGLVHVADPASRAVDRPVAQPRWRAAL